MEASSPLAAMHRPSAAPFGRRPDYFSSVHVRLSPGKPSRPVGRLGGAGLFNIRDQLNQESFGVHGSSPAGSLAADLCQNFSIGEDGSPRFPTPRRALFTSCHAPSNNARSTMSKRGSSFLKCVPASPSAMSIESLMEMTPVPKKMAPPRFSIPLASLGTGVDSPASPSPNMDMELVLESPCPNPQPRSQPRQMAELPQMDDILAPAPAQSESEVQQEQQQEQQEQQQQQQEPIQHDASAKPSALFAMPTCEPPARPMSAAERRSMVNRASLNRAKGYSYSGVPRAQSVDHQLPVFKFNATQMPSMPTASSSLSISECFQDSPPQPMATNGLAPAAPIDPAERRPQSSYSPCPVAGAKTGLCPPIRFRPPLSSTNSTGSASSSRNGSPVSNAHLRRTSSSMMRPKRQYRRSLSMFENPVDVMKNKRGGDGSAAPSGLKPSLLASVMDTDESAPAEPSLPHFFPDGQSDSIPRLTRETMLRVLDGEIGQSYDHKLIVDCRFEYEYEGGHIDGAVNFNDKDLLAKHLFRTPLQGRTLIVLHCEYSAHRAPLMARHIRAEDRSVNAENYPNLTYPELYILEGGYSGFFSEHPLRCYPQAYVEMDAAEHAFTCEREMGRLKQARKGFGRAQTFAFGQNQESPSAGLGPAPTLGSGLVGRRALEKRTFTQYNDFSSPTAPGRSLSYAASPMLGGSPCPGSERGFARRRMASY